MVAEEAIGPKKPTPNDQKVVVASSLEEEGWLPCHLPGEDEGSRTTIGELLQEQSGSAKQYVALRAGQRRRWR
jgi:hypothetical protein